MSSALVERGFRFVGPTICYAFMQAVGMVNDHLMSCFRYPELLRLANRRLPRPAAPRLRPPGRARR
jgi:hypothetical protein